MQMKLFLPVLVLSLVAGVHTVFIEEPSSATVAENEVAEFRCRVNSGLQGWAVGGEFVASLNSTNFTTRSEPASDGGPPVHTLSIVGRSAYSGTTVQCFSFSFSGISNSSLATLQIQGLLAAVPVLSATPLAGSILFSWAAPFSLNLTNTEPDITYCVDVLSSGGAGLVAGGCGLTETQYSFSPDVRSPCDTFTAVVTPVNGAGNGTASQPVTGTFFAAPVVPSVPNVTVKFPIQPLRTFNVSVNFSKLLVVYACNYAVIIESNDGPTLQPVNIMMPVDKIIEGQTLTLTLNTSAVPLNRNYSLEIFLENSAGSATTLPARLSTHDVQELQTPMPSSGDDELIIVFAENSNALGCLVIVARSDLEMFYIGYLDNGTLTADSGMLRDTLPIAGLPAGSYEVAVYDVERDSTMPGTHAADNETLVIDEPQLETDSDGVSSEISEGVLVTPNDDREICVNCTIPADVSATECVVITHPAGSLDEIKTFPVLNDTVGCEPVPTSQAYYIAIFGRLDERIVSLTKRQTPTDNVPSGGTAVIIAVVVVVVVAMVIVLVVVPLLIFLYKRGKTVEIPLHSEPDKPSEPNPEMHDNVSLLVLDAESPPTYDSIVTTATPAEASGSPPPPPRRSDTPTGTPPVPPRSADAHEHKDKPQSKAEGQGRLQCDYNSPALSLKSFDLPPPIPERLYDTEPDESVSTKTSIASSPKPDPLYETVKPPDKVSHGKAGTEPMYASTTPSTKFTSPPKQDTEVHYDVAAAYKSDGKTYAIANVRPPKDDTERPTDKNAVAYETIDHRATAKARPQRKAPAVAAPVPAAQGLTKDLLFEKLLPLISEWKTLAEEFKLNEDLIDEIYTNNDRDEDCLKEVIRFWYKNSDFKHTWSEVVTALKAIGECTLAQNIQEEYIPTGIQNLPGTPMEERSQVVSLPPSTLQPTPDPVLQGSFTASSSAAMETKEPTTQTVEQDEKRAVDKEEGAMVTQPPQNSSMHDTVHIDVDTYEVTSEDKFCGEGHNNTDDHVVEFTLSKNEDEISGHSGDESTDRKFKSSTSLQSLPPAARLMPTHDQSEWYDVFYDDSFIPYSHLINEFNNAKTGLEAQNACNNQTNKLETISINSMPAESGEEEGKMTLYPSRALTLLRHATEISFASREHICEVYSTQIDVEIVIEEEDEQVILGNGTSSVDEAFLTVDFGSQDLWPNPDVPNKDYDVFKDRSVSSGHKKIANTSNKSFGGFNDHSFSRRCKRGTDSTETSFGHFYDHNFTPGCKERFCTMFKMLNLLHTVN